MHYEKIKEKDGVKKIKRLEVGKKPDGSFGFSFSSSTSKVEVKRQTYINGVPVFDINQNSNPKIDNDFFKNTDFPEFPDFSEEEIINEKHLKN